MDKQYIVRTPSKEYNGVTCGVRFYNGEALIAPHTISPYLDWTIPEIADKMVKDFGYEVTEIVREVQFSVRTEKSTPKPKRKTKKEVAK